MLRVTLVEPPARQHSQEPNVEPVQQLMYLREAKLRKRLAWSLGVTGILSTAAGFASYLAARHVADDMRASDPFERNDTLEQSWPEYMRRAHSVAPFALTGSVLMSASVLAGAHVKDLRSPWWAWGALTVGSALLASGITLAARPPDAIGQWNVDEPSRQAGALLASLATPLLTYAVTYAVRRWTEDRRTIHAPLAKRELREPR